MKNKKGELNGIGTIFTVFIAVVVGIVLLTQSINIQASVTDKISVTNETDSLTSCYVPTSGEVNTSNSNCNITVDNWYDSDDWRASHGSCNLGGVSVTNSTGNTLTESTDYNLYAGIGVVQFLNTTAANQSNMGGSDNNNSLTDYNFCDEGYNVDSGSRGIAKLWGLFGAFIILGAVVYGIREWI